MEIFFKKNQNGVISKKNQNWAFLKKPELGYFKKKNQNWAIDYYSFRCGAK